MYSIVAPALHRLRSGYDERTGLMSCIRRDSQGRPSYQKDRAPFLAGWKRAIGIRTCTSECATPDEAVDEMIGCQNIFGPSALDFNWDAKIDKMMTTWVPGIAVWAQKANVALQGRVQDNAPPRAKLDVYLSIRNAIANRGTVSVSEFVLRHSVVLSDIHESQFYKAFIARRNS